jgi:signal transduction histidine kinase
MEEFEVEMKKKKNPKETFDYVALLKEAVETKVEQLLSANKELKKKIFDLYTIFEITRQMASILEMDTLLENILKTCISQLDLKGALIVTKENSKADFLDFCKFAGMNQDAEKMKFKILGDLVKSLQSKNRPVFLDELQKELPHNLELAKTKKWGSQLVVPLFSRNEMVGMLFLLPKNSLLPFSEADLEFLTILSNQIATSLENAILYQTQKKTAQMLLQSEKLAALGQLSAGIAHEINNPLGIIKNYLLLLSQKVSSPKGKKELKVIQEETERIARIVRKLLDFYKPGMEKQTPTDIKKIVEETLSLVSSELKNGNIKTIKDFEEGIPSLFAYPDQLKQVFLNLLMNSKDSMPKGGEISISLAKKKDKIEINFADNGPGIPEEILSRIFEPFFTTKANQQGTGLGLWICYSIIDNHKGTIKATNLKGKGACFTIDLPIASEEN